MGLYVFHHNNNFNLINIYSSKTLMFCFANFFVAMLRVQIFLCPFGALQIFFTNSSTPSLPPPTRSTGQSHKDSRHEVRSSSKCTPPPRRKSCVRACFTNWLMVVHIHDTVSNLFGLAPSTACTMFNHVIRRTVEALHNQVYHYRGMTKNGNQTFLLSVKIVILSC